MSGNTIYDSGIADLANAHAWEWLREFKGYSMGLSELAAGDFADAPIFSRLETLELSENWLGDQGIVRLVHGNSAMWRCLDVGQNEITDEGAEVLARSLCTARLEQLVLRDNMIGGVQAWPPRRTWHRFGHWRCSATASATRGRWHSPVRRT